MTTHRSLAKVSIVKHGYFVEKSIGAGLKTSTEIFILNFS
ncbi:hypothetical protein LEP1GSC016_1981 [Leptospira borgpetersenii serovar Hardjo-bovis str. Sponselee]|uniref:Uncharacterized protein n=1 Tax=Leptospira borgpetersenii serovar Hardjo-bovis str. Sponselee TaxID=1303729 RepID=M6C0U6_LEPBO|nr:hypothetical protein LEP1GSC016_1981 [Leptospira borgpetersenii serovar Hardjo-bovis str. Sponselee]